ncbi:MAG: phosphodiester glycosidase family protein [Erysipelotrichaceae bacterium]|nr:phosphodiester glycosidase family protein [Erysipelotrichaceae bacterium]
MKKEKMFYKIDCLLILGLCLFVLLDTFVISRSFATVSDVRTETTAETVSYTESGSVLTADSYADEDIQIEISEYVYNGTTVYVADVQLSSPKYLYSAFASNTYGKNVTAATSEIAEEANALLAINGDYYGARNSGYVLRNGVLYRSTSASADQEDLVINSDGSFSIIREGEVSAEELLNAGALQVYSFGPALIEDGEIAVSESEEVGKAKASNPRTAICEIEPLHYLLVVSDGRTEESEGLSLHELAQFLQQFNVKTAYNLDGGGSSTMVFNGTLINNPTTSGRSIKERSVSDALCIGL